MDINRRKVFIATPAYGGMCHVSYTIGLLDTYKVLSHNDYDLTIAMIGNESLIQRARNELVRQFLASNAYYLLFIDADIDFKGTDVLKLIEANKDLICGLYPKKAIDWERINILAKQGYDNLEKYGASYVVNALQLSDEDNDKPLTSPIVEIRHGGTGFMLITRNVFEHLSPFVKEYHVSTIPNRNNLIPPLTKEFFAVTVDDTNYLLSEDYYFCNLWTQHGGKIYADLSISLSHYGTYSFKGDLLAGGANSNNI